MDLFLVYLLCFGAGLLFTLISALMSHGFGHDGHAGGGHGADGHAEAGYSSHDMPGFAALSPTTIASFVTAFGGFGIILSQIQRDANRPWVSAPLSVRLVDFAIAGGRPDGCCARCSAHTQSSSESKRRERWLA